MFDWVMTMSTFATKNWKCIGKNWSISLKSINQGYNTNTLKGAVQTLIKN